MRTMSLPTFLLVCILNCHKSKCIRRHWHTFFQFFGVIIIFPSFLFAMPKDKLSWFACLHFSSPNQKQKNLLIINLVLSTCFYLQCQVNKLHTCNLFGGNNPSTKVYIFLKIVITEPWSSFKNANKNDW